MHELGVVEELIRLAADKAREHAATRVNSLNLVVGTLTGLEPESLRFYYELLSQGTILEGSVLEISLVRPELECLSCKLKFEQEQSYNFTCPACGEAAKMMKPARDFFIDSLDIEQ